jgi:hypothetical protein
MRRTERPMLSLPRALLLAFVLLLVGQIVHHHIDRERLENQYRGLSQPFSAAIYRGLAMGSEQLFGHLLAIRLQLHDNQVGRHFNYNKIDYGLLIDWLDRISEISPATEYPMLLASRVYTTTRDPEQLRQILGFIERRFDDDPQLHWRRLTEASLTAKYKLDDLDLALQLARKLTRLPASVAMPHWARDFEFLLLTELNELESAIAVIQALLKTEAVDDPDERRFLQGKLLDLRQKLFDSQQFPEK